MNAPNSRTEVSANDRSVSSMRNLAPSKTRRILEKSYAVRSVSRRLNHPLPHVSKLVTTASRFASNQSVLRCVASASAATRCVSQNSSTENGAESLDVSETFTSSVDMQNARHERSSSRFTSVSAAKHRTASGLVRVATNANRSRDAAKSYPGDERRSEGRQVRTWGDFTTFASVSLVAKATAFIARANSRRVSPASVSANRRASSFVSTRRRSSAELEVAFSSTRRASAGESTATPSCGMGDDQLAAQRRRRARAAAARRRRRAKRRGPRLEAHVHARDVAKRRAVAVEADVVPVVAVRVRHATPLERPGQPREVRAGSGPGDEGRCDAAPNAN